MISQTSFLIWCVTISSFCLFNGGIASQQGDESSSLCTNTVVTNKFPYEPILLVECEGLNTPGVPIIRLPADVNSLTRYSRIYLNIKWNLHVSPILKNNSFLSIDGISLYKLNLGKNRISSIEADFFKGLEKLRSLYLGSNKLTSVPKSSLRLLTNLEELSMGFNPIDSLWANSFPSLPKLKSLNLPNCGLLRIENGAFDSLLAPNLQTLVLTGNLLTRFSYQLVEYFAHLGRLHLNDNPSIVVENCMVVDPPIGAKKGSYAFNVSTPNKQFHQECGCFSWFREGNKALYCTFYHCTVNISPSSTRVFTDKQLCANPVHANDHAR